MSTGGFEQPKWSPCTCRRMTVDGVLMDPCDHDHSCNLDENIFKGIFVRNLRYLIDVTTDKGNLQGGNSIGFFASPKLGALA